MRKGCSLSHWWASAAAAEATERGERASLHEPLNSSGTFPFVVQTNASRQEEGFF